jgi:hypothetical protein
MGLPLLNSERPHLLSPPNKLNIRVYEIRIKNIFTIFNKQMPRNIKKRHIIKRE